MTYFNNNVLSGSQNINNLYPTDQSNKSTINHYNTKNNNQNDNRYFNSLVYHLSDKKEMIRKEYIKNGDILYIKQQDIIMNKNFNDISLGDGFIAELIVRLGGQDSTKYLSMMNTAATGELESIVKNKEFHKISDLFANSHTAALWFIKRYRKDLLEIICQNQPKNSPDIEKLLDKALQSQGIDLKKMEGDENNAYIAGFFARRKINNRCAFLNYPK